MNDLERKITLAEMLGSNVLVQSDLNPERFCWGDDFPRSDEKVTVNEWLHVCWLAEQKLSSQECERYSKIAHWHDTWQERVDNLRAVKS